jgi:hypothetical protein
MVNVSGLLQMKYGGTGEAFSTQKGGVQTESKTYSGSRVVQDSGWKIRPHFRQKNSACSHTPIDGRYTKLCSIIVCFL